MHKFYSSLLLTLLSLAVIGCTTKPAPEQPDFKSTICNPDGTVTFQYQNDNVDSVSVDVQFAGMNKMQKDSVTGLWTVTLGPAAPDMYPYHFVVNGVSVMDPKCDQYFPNEGFKNSLLEIPDANGLIHDIKNVPHGKVEYIHYYSNSLGGVNNAIVYLPPTYEANPDQTYPVFYLLSGTTDTEEVYYKVGRVNYILDNLLAEGKAKDMIVVLPYGNPTKLLPAQKAPTGMGMFRNVVGDDMVNDLMPYVESHYRTINDADHRAIGGFSRGGNQGLSIGLTNLDKFSYLCSYSSFTTTELPNVYDNAADTNSKIHLFWLGVGTDDFLYGSARDYSEFLDNHGIRCVKEYTQGKFGHTWMNAKYFLGRTLPLLFNPEASAEIMADPAPTNAKTGNEPVFNGGTIARLFPRQVVSPEYNGDTVTFRIAADKAKSVQLESELLAAPVEMQKDTLGVWFVTLTENADKVFTYNFIVDGTPIADPTNMYISPEQGFKHSIAYAPSNPYYIQNIGDAKYGTVVYDLNNGTATYKSVPCTDEAVTVQLVLGKNDTAESWFKNGFANQIADKLVADGNGKGIILTTAETAGAKVLKADDYKTWNDRRNALIDLLK